MIGHYNPVNTPKIPLYHDLMWPALQATKELGGSATVSEMNERAIASAGITEEQQAVPHGEDGRMSEVAYRLHWARTHLKGIGALENSARGVWAVTDQGRSMSEPEIQTATKAWRDSFRERRLARRGGQAPGAAVRKKVQRKKAVGRTSSSRVDDSSTVSRPPRIVNTARSTVTANGGNSPGS
jgi:restriction endonuclease Mrr